MSTIPSEATSSMNEPLANLNILDYPGADIILRSQDSHRLRVPKIFIILNSPILGELIRKALDSLDDANTKESLPVIQLPERGKILRYLLTFILPELPVLPPTHEETMELLSVAQKYQMEAVLVHIRGTSALQNPLPIQLESALYTYALAQKYGLRPEALRSARAILKHPVTIEELGDKLNILSSASLYQLWKYYERVQTILVSDLAEFRQSGARGTLTGVSCTKLSSSEIPRWVDRYIASIGNAPNLFDPLELNIAVTRHIMDGDSDDGGSDDSDGGSDDSVEGSDDGCKCGSVSSQTMHRFWNALESVVNGSYEKAESGLSLVQEREDPQTTSPMTPTDSLGLPDTNFIVRSSDLVDFRVHKPVLAVASEVFKDLLALPQPSGGEAVDGLPVVQLSEDSDLLRSLVSMLYPLHPVIPKSYEKVLYLLVNFTTVVPNTCYKVLYLLAACQKYEMAAVRSSIRDKVNQGVFPAPKGAEAFSAYAIASSKGLIPEMENAARQSLDHPMTFEILGEGLRLSEGWALRDLANFRKHYQDNLMSSFHSSLKTEESQFNIWSDCAAKPGSQNSSYLLSKLPMSKMNGSSEQSWLAKLYQKYFDELQGGFSKPLLNPRRIREEYLLALQDHIDSYCCISCTKAHIKNGETFCRDLEDRLTQTLNEALSDLISDK